MLAPIVFAGLVSMPLALPILPVDSAAAYADFWHVNTVRVENFAPLESCRRILRTCLAGRDQAEVIASVYNALPAEDRERAAILTGNYGRGWRDRLLWSCSRACRPHQRPQ